MRVFPFISYLSLLVSITLECVLPLHAYLMHDIIYTDLRLKPVSRRKDKKYSVLSGLNDKTMKQEVFIDISEKVDEPSSMHDDHVVSVTSSTMLNLSGYDAILKFNSHLCIEGILMGAELRCNKSTNTYVTIEKDGELHADVLCAENVIIHGKLVGNVNCKKLHVSRSADIIGDVTVEKMSLEEGGTILGIIRCGKNVSQKWMNVLVNEEYDLGEGFSFLGIKNDKQKDKLLEAKVKIIPLKKKHLNYDSESPKIASHQIKSQNVSLGTDANNTLSNNNEILSHPSSNKNNDEIEKSKKIDVPSSSVNNLLSRESNFTFENKRKDSSLPKNEAKSKSRTSMFGREGDVKKILDERMTSSCKKNGKSFGNNAETKNLSHYSEIGRSKSPTGEKTKTSESTGITPLARKPEKFVDDFGNPLLRGAGHDQVVSFRACRSMCKETRELLDHTRKTKIKAEVEMLSKLCKSPRSHPFLAKKNENSRQGTGNEKEELQIAKENFSIENKQQRNSANEINKKVTEIRNDDTDNGRVDVPKKKKRGPSDDFMPPFLLH